MARGQLNLPTGSPGATAQVAEIPKIYINTTGNCPKTRMHEKKTIIKNTIIEKMKNTMINVIMKNGILSI